MAKPTMTAAQVERKRVDDYIQSRLLEQRVGREQVALKQPKVDASMQKASDLRSGLSNLVDILMGRSSLQTGSKK